jgi:hypothetical protein
MYNKLIAILIIAAAFSLGGCRKLPVPGKTATVNMSNGYWVTAYSSVNGLVSVTPANSGMYNHIFINTYNTTDNTTDSIWVDEMGAIGDLNETTNPTYVMYDFKVTAPANYTAYTFNGGGFLTNWSPNNTTSAQIVKGEIFPKGGKSPTGIATDSIYVQVVFQNNPSDTLTLLGVAFTGYPGDNYPVFPTN